MKPGPATAAAIIAPLLIVAAVAACSSARVADSSTLVERRDSLRARLCEELSVRLDGVVIIPPDSVHPPVVAARTVELQHSRRNDAVATSATDVAALSHEEHETSAPAPAGGMGMFWILFAVATLAYLLGARRGN